MKGLSIIAVNYNSSNLLKRCIGSIISNSGNLPLEVIVVDNGSRREERDALNTIQGNVKVIFKRNNCGYAKAVNEGIMHSNGDFILITNPDVLYMPHSIEKMIEAITSLPNCGGVGPRIWWDEEMTFMLPFSEIITPLRVLRSELMTISKGLRDVILKNWIRRSLRYWLSDTPIPQEMLSGACIMTKRGVIEDVGGFDEVFPLYFEDTDWCLRVRKAGYRLYMIPNARIVHYYNQSAKQETETSQEKFNYSSTEYLKKHFRTQLNMVNYIRRFLGHKELDFLYKDIGIHTEPPTLEFKDKGERLILLSTVSTLIPSAGAFVNGDCLKINDRLWMLLAKGRYFIRAFELKGLKGLGSWSFVKG
ncbi:MAG: hypothetical protein Fur0020_11420 [Thermodesulfovibrionia bacterium]